MDTLKESWTNDNQDLPETAEVTGEIEELVDPETTLERIWFSLQKGDIRFKIGLTDILLCLKFAEEIGEIPPLPSMWWSTIEDMYPHNGAFLTFQEEE